MPGKYSHSVVLADYSTRGIINLSEDQHVAYTKSSPYPTSLRSSSRQESNRWPDRSPAAHPRSQSALAYTGQYGLRSGRTTSHGRYIIGEHEAEDRGNGPVSAYARHQSIPDRARRADKNVPPVPRHIDLSTLEGAAITPKARPPVESPTSKLKHASNSGSRVVGDNRNETEIHKLGHKEPDIPPRFHHVKPERKSETAKMVPVKPAPATEVGVKSNIKLETRPSNIQPTIKTVRRQVSQDTQTYKPHLSEGEPDFEGFTDETHSQPYFELAPERATPVNPKTVSQASRPSGQPETTLSMVSSKDAAESRRKPSRSLFAKPADAGPSVKVGGDSKAKLNLPASSSLPSSTKATPKERIDKHADTRKTGLEGPAQDWTLPEIDEDGTFGPDFFIQGPEDPIPRVDSDDSFDSFLNRPLGTVSAGRDIDFTKDDDDESEADAACPPDIGRFRPGEDSGGSQPLEITKANGTAGKGGTLGRQTPISKGMGLFARLRSKNRPRG